MSNNDNLRLRIEFTEDESINQIEINKNSTIQNLKLAIQNTLNINCDEQVLINKGEILQNDKLIKDYNIINNNKIILIKKEKDPNADIENSVNNDDLNKKTKDSNIIENNVIENNDNNTNTNGNNNKNNKTIHNTNEKDEINTSSNNQIKKTTQGYKKETTKNKKTNNQLIKKNKDSDEEKDKFYQNYNKNQNNNNNSNIQNQNKNPSIISKFIEGISDITDVAQKVLKNPEAIYPLLKNPLFMPFIESDPDMKDILESPENFTKTITKQKKFKNANTFVDSLANILNVFRDTNNNNQFKEKKKDNSDNSESESDDEFS